MFLAGDLDLFVESADFVGVDSEGDSVTVGFKDEAGAASVSGESFGDGNSSLTILN